MEPSPLKSPLTDSQWAHLALRLILGVNIATHGLVRVGHSSAFAEGMAHDFAETMLPRALVLPFAIVLPSIELLVGVGVLLGLRLRVFLMTGALIIAILTFGACLRQAWDIAGLQLVYGLAYYVLLARAADARFSLGGDNAVV